MRKMIIAGSSSFWKEALSYKKKFEKSGYKVLSYPKRDDGPQTWRELYECYYKELLKADDIFVLNLDKKGIKGYIGYETFAEMSNLVVRKMNGENLNIYLYQWPDKKCGCYDEIDEMSKNGWVTLLNQKYDQ